MLRRLAFFEKSIWRTFLTWSNSFRYDKRWQIFKTSGTNRSTVSSGRVFSTRKKRCWSTGRRRPNNRENARDQSGAVHSALCFHISSADFGLFVIGHLSFVICHWLRGCALANIVLSISHGPLFNWHSALWSSAHRELLWSAQTSGRAAESG